MTRFIPGLDEAAILACYDTAAGNEVTSGKFDNPESSAALVANGLGRFLGRAGDLPALPGCPGTWPAEGLTLEAVVRFPWRGGRHPCLDALIALPDRLIGVESKRYEPFRPRVWKAFEQTYMRDWGKGMGPWVQIRDAIQSRRAAFRHLDAMQLAKHALGLVTEAGRQGRPAVLVYLYASPVQWPDGRAINARTHKAHLDEIETLVAHTATATVPLIALRWEDLLDQWAADPTLADHAAAVRARFGL